MNELLLITPPFTQLNTPYPATAYLKGFLNTKNISAYQTDLGIEVILKIFSAEGLSNMFDHAENKNRVQSDNALRIFALRQAYINTIDTVISFLQGNNPTNAHLICSQNFLPRANRFYEQQDLNQAFSDSQLIDKARFIATLYLEDISDFLVECIDADFGFSRYAEQIGRSANTFDALYNKLQAPIRYIDSLTLLVLDELLQKNNPKLVCISVPFPGNLYSAFRCAQHIKQTYPTLKILMGGGFPNTELRSISDARVFEFFDFITLDNGELPIELIYETVILNKASDLTNCPLRRTFLLQNGKVVYNNQSIKSDYSLLETGTPDYSNLPLYKYISVMQNANPMHNLWSDGRWNKLTMTHGCYWAKCTFCDTSLDYIKIYKPSNAKLLANQMESIIQQTGTNGFHFVDEAAPPGIMRDLALEILKRKLTVTWWTNIRFEKSFTSDLCQLLKASGCIAVSGGLEVASERLLKLINKGVTVEQVAQVAHNFTKAGIMVHAYLMYGFPTQTIQETIDSLEMVRQMFELNLINSAFWHRFALTVHSPIGKNVSNYGLKTGLIPITFAENDVPFTDSTKIDHSQFDYGLKKSIYNFMHGIGFDFLLQDWFDFKIPRTSIAKNYLANSLQNADLIKLNPDSRIIWVGNEPVCKTFTKSKHGNSWPMLEMHFFTNSDHLKITMEADKGEWLKHKLNQIAINEETNTLLSEIKDDFERQCNDDFEPFWYSKPIDKLRKNGLLII